MAYVNGTTHYNLPQTVGTDKRDWADTNQAFADVDAALYSATEDVADAQTEINGLKERMTTAEGNITTNANDISALDGRLTTAEDTITQHTAQIADVRQDTEDMICAYNEASATSIHAYDVGDYFIYNNVLYRAIQTIAIGDTIVPDTNCTTTNVSTEILNLQPTLLATVTSDGSKTHHDILTELHSIMQVSDNLKIVITNDSTLKRVLDLKSVNPQAGTFTFSSLYTSGNNISITTFLASSTNSTAYSATIDVTTSAVSATDNTSTIPTLGIKYKLYKVM